MRADYVHKHPNCRDRTESGVFLYVFCSYCGLGFVTYIVPLPMHSAWFVEVRIVYIFESGSLLHPLNYGKFALKNCWSHDLSVKVPRIMDERYCLSFVLKGCSTVQILNFRKLFRVQTRLRVRNLTFIEVEDWLFWLSYQLAIFFFIPVVVVGFEAVLGIRDIWCGSWSGSGSADRISDKWIRIQLRIRLLSSLNLRMRKKTIFSL
jgi:hypothetical protein